VESSLLAQIGRFFEPVDVLIGLDLENDHGPVDEYMPKENAMPRWLSSMGRGTGTGVVCQGGEPGLRPGFPGGVDALCPCVATVNSHFERRDGDWKCYRLAVLMLTVSLFGGMITYHVALWAGL